jgi:hypothetical protein
MTPTIKITQWHAWQGPETAARTFGRFVGRNGSIPLATTVRELEYELERMDVTDASVAFGLDGTAFTRKGWPLATAHGHPGVVLTYTHPKHGVMRVATDAFYEWADNLRAVVKTLEALRMMDRYGTTGLGQQYQGFRALAASTDHTMTPTQAAVLIKEASKVKFEPERLIEIRELAEIAVRAAIFNAHPDRNPGKPDATEYFHTVERARQALSAHHGGGL